MSAPPRKAAPKPVVSRSNSRFDPRALAEAAGTIATPLALIALVVLVSASVLAVRAVRDDSGTGVWLTAGAVTVLIIALIGAILLALAARAWSS